MGCSRKKNNRRGEGLTPPVIFHFFTLSLKFQTKQSSSPGNSTKLCQISWKFQGQKPRPLEIPHYFFLVTFANSTSFLINPWRNFTCYFFDTTGNSISSILPVFFFLEQPNAKTFASFQKMLLDFTRPIGNSTYKIYDPLGQNKTINQIIVGTPPPLVKGGQDLPKIKSLGGGVQNFLPERGNKPEKGGSGCHFSIILQFNHIYCVYYSLFGSSVF